MDAGFNQTLNPGIASYRSRFCNYTNRKFLDYDMKLPNNEAASTPSNSPTTQIMIETPQAALELTFVPAVCKPLAFNQRL